MKPTEVEARVRHVARTFTVRDIPAGPHHGQLRHAFLGWQWRISVEGEVFSPWMFTFRRQRALRKLGWFSPTLIEEERP